MRVRVRVRARVRVRVRVQSTVGAVVRSILSVSFIFGTASVVFNLKSRFCKENAWGAEMAGDVTTQRRWEAYDKLGTFIIYAVTFVLGIQALGLEGACAHAACACVHACFSAQAPVGWKATCVCGGLHARACRRRLRRLACSAGRQRGSAGQGRGLIRRASPVCERRSD